MDDSTDSKEVVNAAFAADGDEEKDDSKSSLDQEQDGAQLVQNGEADHMSDEEQQNRKEWSDELDKVEDELKVLRETLNSKQRRAAELHKLLGHNLVNDMKEKVKHIQDSDVLLRTNQAFKSAGERTSAVFSNFGKKFGDVRSRLGESIGTSFSNVKAKVNGNRFDIRNRLSSRRSSADTHSISSPLDEVPGY